jgi:hypothetical protein
MVGQNAIMASNAVTGRALSMTAGRWQPMSKERYTKVFDFFWDDENIVLLSDDAKLLYLYVMTCRHGNAAGIFILPKGYIQDDLRWADKRLDKPFIELLNNGLILYDDHSRVLVVVNHLKHNKVENPNQVKNVHDTISLLPKSKGYSGFIKRLDKPFHKPLVEGLSKRLPQPVAVTVTETVTVKTSCQQQAVDESPIPLKQNKKPCPHTEIINLYHEKLPELASISTKVVGGKEQKKWTAASASH